MESYIIFALIGMVLFGLNGILYKVAPNTDSATLTFISFLASAIVAFIYWFFFVPEKTVSTPGIAIGALAGALAVGALIFLIAALQMGKASIVMPIRSLSAAVTVVLAILFLSEKITVVKALGIVLAIIAAVLLAL